MKSPAEAGLVLSVFQQRCIQRRFFMGQDTDNLDQFVFQFLAGDHNINHAVFTQIFGALETFRQFFANRLFNHAGPGKTDNAAFFGNVNMAKEAETPPVVGSVRTEI